MITTPLQSGSQKLPEMGPAETAQYTKETLESLRKIALKQKQVLLAHLLELAAVEAKALAQSQSQETRFPG
ncbi:MAG TPA: hypothetical protein VGC27_12525 [Rhizomicrobium sp.]